MHRGLTNHGFACVFVRVEGTFAVSDEEGEVEQVLDGLPEVVRVDDEFEDVHRTLNFVEDMLEL